MKKELSKTLFSTYRSIRKESCRNFPAIYKILTKKKFPEMIQIQTTSRCNGNCSICPYSQVKNEFPQGNMDINLFKKIIDEIADYDVKEIHPFLMNEPLMDRRIFEFIEYIKQKIPSVVIKVNTNGSLLNKEKAEMLANSKVDYVDFHVEGIRKDTYEKIMTSLNLEKTLERIEYFLSFKKPFIKDVRAGVAPNILQEGELEEYREYWHNRGVRVVTFIGMDRAGNINHEGLVGGDIENTKLRGCKMDRHLRWFHILFNGDVVLCCEDYRREIVLGNIRNQSIYEIWHSSEYETVRAKINSKEECETNFLCNRCYFAIKGQRKKSGGIFR